MAIRNAAESSALVVEAPVQVDDQKIMAGWELKAGDKTLAAMPRVALYRALLCNHQYHHRGQLSVYLRLLDVSIPSIYGPSADENPFG